MNSNSISTSRTVRKCREGGILIKSIHSTKMKSTDQKMLLHVLFAQSKNRKDEGGRRRLFSSIQLVYNNQ